MSLQETSSGKREEQQRSLAVPNLAAFEKYAPQLFADKEWQANYQKMAPLVESGYRQTVTIVE